jgi:hypothetical protein
MHERSSIYFLTQALHDAASPLLFSRLAAVVCFAKRL